MNGRKRRPGNEKRKYKKDREGLKKRRFMHCTVRKAECNGSRSGIWGGRADKCTHCGGVFMDAGELDKLFAASKSKSGMMGKIWNVFC